MIVKNASLLSSATANLCDSMKSAKLARAKKCYDAERCGRFCGEPPDNKLEQESKLQWDIKLSSAIDIIVC